MPEVLIQVLRPTTRWLAVPSITEDAR